MCVVDSTGVVALSDCPFSLLELTQARAKLAKLAPSFAGAHFVSANAITEVTYALIDVEGHEVSVLRGMKLEAMASTFPGAAAVWADTATY